MNYLQFNAAPARLNFANSFVARHVPNLRDVWETAFTVSGPGVGFYGDSQKLNSVVAGRTMVSPLSDHPINQDAIGCVEQDEVNHDIVGDGLGSHDYAELASEILCRIGGCYFARGYDFDAALTETCRFFREYFVYFVAAKSLELSGTTKSRLKLMAMLKLKNKLTLTDPEWTHLLKEIQRPGAYEIKIQRLAAFFRPIVLVRHIFKNDPATAGAVTKVWRDGQKIFSSLASIGDSGVLVFRRKSGSRRLNFVTRTMRQSFIRKFLNDGEFDNEAILKDLSSKYRSRWDSFIERNHPKNSTITSWMGRTQVWGAGLAQVPPFELKPGYEYVILTATDGLINMGDPSDLASVMSQHDEPQPMIESLWRFGASRRAQYRQNRAAYFPRVALLEDHKKGLVTLTPEVVAQTEQKLTAMRLGLKVASVAPRLVQNINLGATFFEGRTSDDTSGVVRVVRVPVP